LAEIFIVHSRLKASASGGESKAIPSGGFRDAFDGGSDGGRGLPRFHNNQPMAIKTSKLIHYAAEASD